MDLPPFIYRGFACLLEEVCSKMIRRRSLVTRSCTGGTMASLVASLALTDDGVVYNSVP